MSRLIKRLFDVLASIIGLIILSPIILIAAVISVISQGFPIFFHHERLGRDGFPFTMVKFRTMDNGHSLSAKHDITRLTPWGRVLRRTSIDELPQLLNVLKGEMSLVGPRPPVLSEVVQYNLDDKKRLDAKPGITCIWQVSGRSKIPFKQQVQMDKEYIKDQSFIKDVKLLLKTIPAVLFAKGSY